MTANVRVDVRIDQRALNRELRERNGTVGKVVAGFAGEATKTIKDEFRSRAGGAWWPVHSTITDGTTGTRAVVTVKKTRPHRIVAKNVPMLVFFWEREGRMFTGPEVNHPGSTPSVKLVLSAIEKAGRRMTFIRPST